MREWWSKLRNLIAGERRLSDELRDEMAAHLEFEIEDRLARGMQPEEARLSAARRFGNATAIAERTREVWTVRWLEALLRDVRYAVRGMLRRPAFTAVAVLSLAIALGANTAVFSFVNAVVLKTLPVAGADRLVNLRQKNEQFHMENCCFTYPFFRELRRQDREFDDILALSDMEINLTDREQTERLQGELVSGNYFRMLGIRPAAGRLLDDADDATEGAGPVCVISYRLWQERFGGDPGVIGRRVLLNLKPFQIVGVSQAGFTGASLYSPRDIQVPTAMTSAFLGEKRDSFGFLFLMARLQPRVSPERALVWLNVSGREIQKATGFYLKGAHDDFLLYDASQGTGSGKEQLGKPVLVLLLLVAVLLLVACANVAALLLVRSVERTREAGMRLAIGASRAVLFRQFLAEATLLAAAGGVAGWGLALVLIQVLLHLLPQDDALVRLVRPDGLVFAFSAAATLAAGLIFGLLPAWRASRAAPLPAIHGISFARPGRHSLISRVVIATQIALSLGLVFCAGLFARSLHNLRAIDLGFRPENVVTMPIDISQTVYREQAPQFFGELLRRVRQAPEIRAASLSGLNVITGSMASTVVAVPGYANPGGLRPVTYVMRTSGGYFRTMGIPLLAGRDFLDTDRDGSDSVGSAIVNEQFARQYFGGDALGKSFEYGGGRKVLVVGVARTSKFRYIREDPQPVMYLPNSLRGGDLFLQVRASGDPSRAVERLRTVVHDLAASVPPGPVSTMEMQIDAALARERLLAFLSTLLGVVAAGLAAIGLYGVLAFAVTRRTREIGIRLSVGAQRPRIVALFLKDSAWTVVAGLAAGIPLMFAAGRLASSLLYGLEPRDTATMAGAVAALALVALAAAAIPSARAARVDPMRALRHE